MNHIRTLRESLGWTQRQLAEKIGVTTDHVSKLERGHRRLSQDWMERIAAAVGVSPAALIGAEPRIPVAGEITGAGTVLLYKDSRTEKHIPAPPGIAEIGSLAALEVKDNGLLPLCGKGWHLCYRLPGAEKQEPRGLSVAALEDGRVLLREIRKGRPQGSYSLHSHNAPPLENQALQWSGRVVALIPG